MFCLKDVGSIWMATYVYILHQWTISKIIANVYKVITCHHVPKNIYLPKCYQDLKKENFAKLEMKFRMPKARRFAEGKHKQTHIHRNTKPHEKRNFRSHCKINLFVKASVLLQCKQYMITEECSLTLSEAGHAIYTIPKRS